MRPSSILRRVRRVALVLGFASSAFAADLPEGTLAVVSAKSLEGLDDTVSRLLEPWRLKFNGLAPIFQTLAPGTGIPRGPVAIGLLKRGAKALPFGILATENAEELERSLRARPAGKGKFALVAGYPVFLSRVEGGVFFSLQPQLEGPPVACVEQLLGEADAALAVTKLGFEEAADWSARLGLTRGVIDWRRVRSLNDALRLLNRLGRFTPLLRRLAQEGSVANLRLSADPKQESIAAALDFQCSAGDAAPPAAEAGAKAPTLNALLGDRAPILTFRSDRPLPPPLVRLALAWSECQPSDIDADRYDPEAFAAYAESATELIGAITQTRLAWFAPAENEPLATNGLECFRVKPGTELGEKIGEVTSAMNRTIRQSRARTPLLTELKEIDSPGGPGVRTTVDVLRALGGADMQEISKLVERYYGPKGQYVVDHTPLGGDQWLRSSDPDNQATRERLVVDQASATQEAAELRVWLGRWLVWQQRIDDVGKEKDAGRKVRPPMTAAPPLRLRISAHSDRLRCSAELPTETYQAFAAYWIAQKIAPEGGAQLP